MKPKKERIETGEGYALLLCPMRGEYRATHLCELFCHSSCNGEERASQIRSGCGVYARHQRRKASSHDKK